MHGLSTRFPRSLPSRLGRIQVCLLSSRWREQHLYTVLSEKLKKIWWKYFQKPKVISLFISFLVIIFRILGWGREGRELRGGKPWIGFPRWLRWERIHMQCRRPRFNPWSRRSTGVGHGNPLQYLAWRIPWTEEPGGLQSVGLQRVRHDWVSKHPHNPWITWSFLKTCTGRVPTVILGQCYHNAHPTQVCSHLLVTLLTLLCLFSISSS